MKLRLKLVPYTRVYISRLCKVRVVYEGLGASMQGLTDIHTHILPGVDDGAKNSSISMEMLKIAWKDGIRQIILTPHNKPMRHNVSPESMHKIAEEMTKKALAQGMEFKFLLGNEFYYRSDLSEVLDGGNVCTMADSAYVLIEFGPMDDFEYIRGGVYQILAGGYRPIVAHVERYQCILSKPQRVEELKEMGAYIQVNAGSIMGQYGFNAKHVTRKLLKQKLIHFVASDAHDTEKRAPRLSECAKYISKKYGEDIMQQLFYENPKKLIADDYI